MLSIESFINGIISFLKRLVYTFYSCLFRTKKFTAELFQDQLGGYSEPNLFFVISLLSFTFFFDELKLTEDELIDVSVDKKLLYAIPLAIVIYVFFLFLSKVLNLRGKLRIIFERLLLYWWGCALFFFMIVYASFRFFESGREIQVWFYVGAAVLHLFILVNSIIVIVSFYRERTKEWPKFLIAPLLATAAIFTTGTLIDHEERLLTPPIRTSITIMNQKWSILDFEIDSTHYKDSLYFSMEVFVQNNANHDVYIDKEDPFFIHESPLEKYNEKNASKFPDLKFPPENYSPNGLLFLEFRCKDFNHENRLILLKPEQIAALTLFSQIDTISFHGLSKTRFFPDDPDELRTVMEISTIERQRDMYTIGITSSQKITAIYKQPAIVK